MGQHHRPGKSGRAGSGGGGGQGRAAQMEEGRKQHDHQDDSAQRQRVGQARRAGGNHGRVRRGKVHAAQRAHIQEPHRARSECRLGVVCTT